jgi:hypothetical protein
MAMIEGFEHLSRIPIHPEFNWGDFLAGLPPRLGSWRQDFFKVLSWVERVAWQGCTSSYGIPPLGPDDDMFDLGYASAELAHCGVITHRMLYWLQGRLPECLEDKLLGESIRSAPDAPDRRHTHWDKEPYQAAINALQGRSPDVRPILDCSIHALEGVWRDIAASFGPVFGFERYRHVFRGWSPQAVCYLELIIDLAEALEACVQQALGKLRAVRRRIPVQSNQEASHDHADPAS